MKKRIKSIICLVLTVALIIGFAPNVGASVVNAAEEETILSEDFEGCEGESLPSGWNTTEKKIDGRPEVIGNVLDNESNAEYRSLKWYVNGGDKVGFGDSITAEKEDSNKYAYHSYGTSSEKLSNDLSTPLCDLNSLSSAKLMFSFKNRYDGEHKDEISVYYRIGESGELVPLFESNGKNEEWVDKTINLPADALKNNVQIVFRATVNYGYGVYVDNVKITGVKKAPEAAPEVTPTKDDSGKKNYKNEWVDGQWYDANGKTDYKYKGGWKNNDKGWWYEDASGWYPTARWQKIDGEWYYFDDIGYMATNEYAGNWSAYSEGYWWVGEDGAWDGSEPGVWRLSGTKWWFKDSTGWYAKGKWYKIGGTWYEFDADGWWIEK